MNQIQQGDVCLERIDSIPENSIEVKRKDKGLILAEGEHTGHCHRIEEKDIAWLYEKNGILYVKALEDCELKHEEHRTITIPKGNWKVGIVREYDYFLEMVRQVRD